MIASMSWFLSTIVPLDYKLPKPYAEWFKSGTNPAEWTETILSF